MDISKNLRVENNVTLRVIDKATGKLIQEHEGHNTATNSLIEGIARYLSGAGVLNQGQFRLNEFVPKYISLGTMGLINQDEDENGLPVGISGHEYTSSTAVNYQNYINESPGYGSDGYSSDYNNNRIYYGLGPAYTSFSPTNSYKKGEIVYYKGLAYEASEDMLVYPESGTYNFWNSDKWFLLPEFQQSGCWELITPECPRTSISFRDIVPEYEAEVPKTIDVVFSAMISTDTFAQFRDSDKDYMFISEAGLWSDQDYVPDSSARNGLVAGYRLAPADAINRYMDENTIPDSVAIIYLENQGISDPTPEQISEAKSIMASENQQMLREEILRVERNQVVQVVWKMQLGNLRNALGITTSAENVPNGLTKIDGIVYLTVDGQPIGTGAEINGKDFVILGNYPTVPDLEQAVPSPAVGDAYGVGESDPYDIYIWNGVTWVNYGPIGQSNPIDTSMSNSSTNAVQNKVIKDYIDELIGDVHAAMITLNMIIGMPRISAGLTSIDDTIGE